MLAGLRARAPQSWRIILKLRPAPENLFSPGHVVVDAASFRGEITHPLRPGSALMTQAVPCVNMKLYLSLSLGYRRPMISAAQIRAARGLLKWTQAALAAKSGLSVVTLNMIESETVQPRRGSLAAIQGALEAGGVEFIGMGGGAAGVRFRSESQNYSILPQS